MKKIVKFECHECGHKVLVDMVPEPMDLVVVEVVPEGVWCEPRPPEGRP